MKRRNPTNIQLFPAKNLRHQRLAVSCPWIRKGGGVNVRTQKGSGRVNIILEKRVDSEKCVHKNYNWLLNYYYYCHFMWQTPIFPVFNNYICTYNNPLIRLLRFQLYWQQGLGFEYQFCFLYHPQQDLECNKVYPRAHWKIFIYMLA